MNLKKVKSLGFAETERIFDEAKSGDPQALHDVVFVSIWKRISKIKSASQKHKEELYEFLSRLVSVQVKIDG